MGDANASIPTVEPTYIRPMFGADVPSRSITFMSQASIKAGKPSEYGLRKRCEPVRNCRTVTKKDMVYNDYRPKMHVDAETYKVLADGKHMTCGPSPSLPLTTNYYVF